MLCHLPVREKPVAQMPLRNFKHVQIIEQNL